MVTVLLTTVHILISSSGIASAADAPGDSLSSTDTECVTLIGFARSLEEDGDYFRAITEYKRCMHRCCGKPEYCESAVGIGRSYFLAERYVEVLDWCWSRHAFALSAGDRSLLQGHTFFRLGNYPEASWVLRAAALELGQGSAGDKAKYLRGLALIRTGRGCEAIRCFVAVGDASPYYDKATSYATAIARGDTTFPEKRPGVAAALAIIPGAGYAYAGHRGSALVSLIVNGLLWWSAIEAMENGEYAAGVTYGVFALGFYCGGIAGSAESARRYNEHQWSTYQAKYPE
jgi:hypothetical protein